MTIIPGLLALVLIPDLGSDKLNMEYNNAIPLLINEFLPNGMLGLALVGLIAAFMAGVAANVSAFNTVVTYDLWEPYVRQGRDDDYYLRFGRIATVGGILIGILTALIASGYTNIMDYIQLLFSFFNAPLFATFIIGMFWRRMTPWAGFWGLVAGTAGAAGAYYANKGGLIDLGSDQAAAFWGAMAAFAADAIVSVVSRSSPRRSPSRSCRPRLRHGQHRGSRGRLRAGLVPPSAGARVRRAGPDRRPERHLRARVSCHV